MPRVSRLAGISFLAVSLLGVGAAQQTALADDFTYCTTLKAQAESGSLQVNITGGESVTTAAAKVEKVRLAYSRVRKVAPADIAPDLTRIVNTLARIRADYLAMKKASASKLTALRAQVQVKIRDFQSDVDALQEDAIIRCNADATVDDGDVTIDPVPAPAPAPAPASGLLNGTGVYVIGKDIAPGPWTTRGGPNCEAGTSDDPTGVDPTAGFVSPIGVGVATVMVSSQYKYFITRNCPGWRAGTLA
jgi:hypothetical protein